MPDLHLPDTAYDHAADRPHFFDGDGPPVPYDEELLLQIGLLEHLQADADADAARLTAQRDALRVQLGQARADRARLATELLTLRQQLDDARSRLTQIVQLAADDR